MNFSNSCLVCESKISKGTSVLFSCECIVLYCKSCAYRQIAAQPTTYHQGLSCPICRTLSDNIRGIKECAEEEARLINNAIDYSESQGWVRKGRKEDENIRKAILAMVQLSSFV